MDCLSGRDFIPPKTDQSLMEEKDERQELYLRFVKSAIKHKGEDYFDENDLVEIFDYSSDLNDDFVKMEVLLYGAHHFPSSDELKVRRAYFYAMLGNDTAAAMANRQVAEDLPLSRILNIALTDPEPPQTNVDRLTGIVNGIDDFEDEEIIQFVNVAVRVGHYRWLKENRDFIGRKCSYKPTFYYELACVAEENDDEPYAVELFEELTMLDAFNLDFWHRLSEAHAVLNDFNQSVSAADYALAIDPADVTAMRLKARALSRLRNRPDEVIALYDKVREADMMEDADFQPLAAAYLSTGRDDTAVDMMEANCLKTQGNYTALDILIILSPPRARRYIKQVIIDENLNEEAVLDWAKQHTGRGDFFGAAEILSVYIDIHGCLTDNAPAMETFYTTGDYEHVLALYEAIAKAGKENGEYIYRPGIILPVIMSNIRIGATEKATMLATDALNHAKRDKYNAPIDTLARIYRCSTTEAVSMSLGFIETLRQLLDNYLNSPLFSALSTDDYDPLRDRLLVGGRPYDPWEPLDASKS